MTTEEKVKAAKKIMRRKNNKLSVNFSRIYPFTTENISEYLPYFTLKNRSLLTVGSSSDQTINAIGCGCKDITVVDICPFTKEYYELKKAALVSLPLEEFLELISFNRKRSFFSKEPEKKIDRNILKKIEEALSSEESYDFWKCLLRDYSPEVIRKQLFSTDEYPQDAIQELNPYLEERNYKITQTRLQNVTPTFREGNILRENYDRQFDNIWLSNIFDYSMNKTMEPKMKEFLKNLSEEGKILLYYLYSTSVNGESVIYHQIYDPKRAIRSFPEGCEYYDIRGVDSILSQNKTKDGIIIYQKRH